MTPATSYVVPGPVRTVSRYGSTQACTEFGGGVEVGVAVANGGWVRVVIGGSVRVANGGWVRVVIEGSVWVTMGGTVCVTMGGSVWVGAMVAVTVAGAGLPQAARKTINNIEGMMDFIT